MTEHYVLRARVIEGEIPMPSSKSNEYRKLTQNNFEIFAPYTKENFYELYNIGKAAWQKGTLSKYEIIGWAGGVNNHEPERFLWSFRPDMYNFERIPNYLLYDFDKAIPKINMEYHNGIYERFWQNLKYGFSLNAYKDMALNIPLPTLLEKINESRKNEKNICKQASIHNLIENADNKAIFSQQAKPKIPEQNQKLNNNKEKA